MTTHKAGDLGHIGAHNLFEKFIDDITNKRIYPGPPGPGGPVGPAGPGADYLPTAPPTRKDGSLHETGDLWVDSDDVLAAYQLIAASVAPSSPFDGQLWFDSVANILKRFDGGTASWVPMGVGPVITGPVGPAGPAGPVGPIGPMGPKGDTGTVGATGPQGPVGPQGNDSTVPGPKGDTGPQGNVGPQGAAGPQGVAGPKGDKGDKGDAGPMGLTGPQGTVGPKGDQGIPGNTGAQGPKGDKGDTGPQGVGLNLKGSVASSTALPATAAAGDGYIAKDTGDLHVWDGTSWHDVGAIVGPKGDTGAQGPKGDKGDAGATGPAGSPGPAGRQGVPGVQGTQGPKGDTGLTGPQGLKGDAGPAGVAGPKGDKGDAGPAGVAGPQGIKGDKGDAGPQGPAGTTGPQGSKGDAATVKVGTVATGAPGSDAKVVNSGSTSAAVLDFTLPRGVAGPAGAPGATGTQGPKGDKGEKGDTGPAGKDGTGVPTFTAADKDKLLAVNTAGSATQWIAAPSGLPDHTGKAGYMLRVKLDGSGVEWYSPPKSIGLTPAFDTPVQTADGFTVNVTNYDSDYTWKAAVSGGTVTQGAASGSTLPLTVTGLAASASATVTVTTTRTGFTDVDGTVTGTAKSAVNPACLFDAAKLQSLARTGLLTSATDPNTQAGTTISPAHSSLTWDAAHPIMVFASGLLINKGFGEYYYWFTSKEVPAMYSANVRPIMGDACLYYIENKGRATQYGWAQFDADPIAAIHAGAPIAPVPTVLN